MAAIKGPVKLREKPIKGGGSSLYLDITYKGKRKTEFLCLYLTKSSDKELRELDRKTLSIARQILSERTIEVESGRYGVSSPEDTELFPYFEKIRENVESRKGRVWNVVRGILSKEFGVGVTFSQIEREDIEALRKRIAKSDVKEGTKHLYWSVVRAVFNQAVRDGIIGKNPCMGIQGFKPSEAKRTYLTPEEITLLSQTKCGNEEIKRGFLFSCLTGLRFSDVRALKWGDVSEENGYTRITFRQQKTKWQEYFDINRQAASLMGERKRKEDCVFNLPDKHGHVNNVVRTWVARAGIDKHVSFHVARHTFATMLLTNGVDLYTVSKLVGHKDIKTTQIYAKIVDEKKRSAVDTIPDILG